MRSDISKKSYIRAAYDILQEAGPEGLTIRSVADRLNCNSANLYRYFSNLEELALYASLKYLDDYIRAVGGRFPTDGLKERTFAYIPITCLRGITWCAMAWVEYQQPGRLLQNASTWKKLNAYLDHGFFDPIEALLK